MAPAQICPVVAVLELLYQLGCLFVSNSHDLGLTDTSRRIFIQKLPGSLLNLQKAEELGSQHTQMKGVHSAVPRSRASQRMGPSACGYNQYSACAPGHSYCPEKPMLQLFEKLTLSTSCSFVSLEPGVGPEDVHTIAQVWLVHSSSYQREISLSPSQV